MFNKSAGGGEREKQMSLLTTVTEISGQVFSYEAGIQAGRVTY